MGEIYGLNSIENDRRLTGISCSFSWFRCCSWSSYWYDVAFVADVLGNLLALVNI